VDIACHGNGVNHGEGVPRGISLRTSTANGFVRGRHTGTVFSPVPCARPTCAILLFVVDTPTANSSADNLDY
jgi:hypothetical protein